MRLFVAIELAPEVRRALGDLIDRLSLVREPVKWVAEENLHVTVKFLGDTPADKLPALRDTLDRVAAGTPPIPARVEGVGGFPGGRHPRVVWVGFEAPVELDALVERVEEALAAPPLDFAPETRPFTPHVTIGRAKEGHQRRRPRPGRAPEKATGPLLAEALALEAAFAAGAATIDALTLFESKLGRGGPTYTALHQARLSGPAG